MYSLALIIFVVSEKKAFEHFPIGSYVKLSSAVVAILVGVLKCRTQFWKRTTQESFHQSLVEIGPVVSEEKILFKFHPPFFLICIIGQNRQMFKVHKKSRNICQKAHHYAYTFWLKIEQFWPFEEISIFSNGGHLGYRTALMDTFLKGDHLRINSAKIG